MDTAGAVCYAAGIYSFARMANFAPGGLSGLAIIINYLWSLPIGIITLILNIPFVIFSYKLVGKTFLLKTARTMIICTLFLDVIFLIFLFTMEVPFWRRYTPAYSSE